MLETESVIFQKNKFYCKKVYCRYIFYKFCHHTWHGVLFFLFFFVLVPSFEMPFKSIEIAPTMRKSLPFLKNYFACINNKIIKFRFKSSHWIGLLFFIWKCDFLFVFSISNLNEYYTSQISIAFIWILRRQLDQWQFTYGECIIYIYDEYKVDDRMAPIQFKLSY